MRKLIGAILTAGILLITGGCAATQIPVVGQMSPTPIPTETPTEKLTPVPTSTPTPIAIITTAPIAEETPLPVSLTPVLEADDHLKTIGEKQEGDSVFRVKIVNGTGLPIKRFRIISMLASYYGDESNYLNLLQDGDVFTDKEERILYYNTADDPSNDSGEKHYNLQLTFTDDTGYVLTDVPFSDMEEGVMYLEDQIVYFDYLSKSTGQQISTKSDELTHLSNRQEAEKNNLENGRYDEEDDWHNEENEDRYDDEDRYDEDRYNDEDHYDEYDGGDEYDGRGDDEYDEE